MSEAIAWAAGLFEGEGNINLRTTSKQSSGGEYLVIQLQLASCDQDVIERFAAVVQVGGTGGPYYSKNPNARPQFRWFCAKRHDAVALLKVLLPYFGERRSRAATHAITTWEGRTTSCR